MCSYSKLIVWVCISILDFREGRRPSRKSKFFFTFCFRYSEHPPCWLAFGFREQWFYFFKVGSIFYFIFNSGLHICITFYLYGLLEMSQAFPKSQYPSIKIGTSKLVSKCGSFLAMLFLPCAFFSHAFLLCALRNTFTDPSAHAH